jgi:hypothetical protein
MAVVVGANSPITADNPPGTPLIGYHNVLTSPNVVSSHMPGRPKPRAAVWNLRPPTSARFAELSSPDAD